MALVRFSRIFGTWPFDRDSKLRIHLLLYSYGFFVVALHTFQRYYYYAKYARKLTVENWFRLVFDASRTCITCCVWLSHLWTVTKLLRSKKLPPRCVIAKSKNLESVLAVTFIPFMCIAVEALRQARLGFIIFKRWTSALQTLLTSVTHTARILILMQFITGVDNLVTAFCEEVPLKSSIQQTIAFQENTLREAKELNDFFHVQLLLNTASTFMALSSESYHIIKALALMTSGNQEKKLVEKVSDDLCWFLFTMYWLFRLTRSCENFYDKVEKLNDHLYEAVQRNDYLRADVKVQLHIIRKPTIEFTACRFFRIGYPLISSVVSGVATYLVILMELATS